MQQDAAVLLPAVQPLSERQQQVFLLLHSIIAAHEPEGFVRLADADLADAAAAIAATLETASRGVIYEHAAASLPAQRLANTIRVALDDLETRGTPLRPADTAAALRAIETGARRAGAAGADPTMYLDAARRMMRASGIAPPSSPEASGPSLIITPT
jgi:hypothetical protein